MTYTVIIEKNGVPVPVGHISNSSFAYDDAYLHGADARPISVSLPLQEEAFSPRQTKCFFDGLPCPRRLHQEDFAQALGIPATEKYEPTDGAYLKDAFALLKHRSANPLEDQLKLWDLTAFNFLIGNTDNHLKNLSLLYDTSLSSVRLAPAYDVISTTVYPGSTRELSMRIGDAVTIDDVSESSFRMAAREVGIGEKLAIKRFSAMAQQFESALASTAEELTGKGFTNAVQLREQILLTGGYRHIDK